MKHIEKLELENIGFQFDNQHKIWVSGSNLRFDYNDGDETENYILDTIRNAKDVSVLSEELQSKIRDWPSLYHLSSRRSNLLRHFESELTGKRILEIGCGCGAITRFLGELGAKEVISIEGSYRRASIARERCRDLENVEIICATSEDLISSNYFDYVLLIGVLEYAPKFLGKNGEHKLLQICKNQLIDDGSLIIAIENQLGLKYFAGFKEDHAGIAMYGINNSYKTGEYQTWGKKELQDILNKNGFQYIEQFIPLPDYKLPVSVITPLGWKSYSNELMQLAIETARMDFQRTPYELFSLEMGNYLIWKNGLNAELSNSFLMFCSKNNKLSNYTIKNEDLAYYYSDGRKLGFNKRNRFIVDDKKLLVLYELLDTKKTDIEVKHTLLEKDVLCTGKSLWFELVEILNKSNWKAETIQNWVEIWLSEILQREGKTLKDSFPEMEISGKWLDATPFNAIRKEDGSIYFLDQEWKSEAKITLGYLFYRGFFHSLLRISTVAEPIDQAFLNAIHLVKSVAKLIWGIPIDSFLEEWSRSDGFFIYSVVANVYIYNLEELSKIHLQKRKSLESLDKEKTQLELERNWLISEKNRLELEKADLLNSTSWKITKPIRFIKRQFM